MPPPNVRAKVAFLSTSNLLNYHAGDSCTAILCDESAVLLANDEAGDARHPCIKHQGELSVSNMTTEVMIDGCLQSIIDSHKYHDSILFVWF